MEGQVKTVAVLWIVYGILGLLLGMLLFGLLFGLSFLPDMDIEGPIILRAVGIGVGSLIALLSIPEIIAGFGLLRHREWGRILTIVLAFFALLEFPIGTALGIYSLVVLLKSETAELFKS